jgi:hypothetical protein
MPGLAVTPELSELFDEGVDESSIHLVVNTGRWGRGCRHINGPVFFRRVRWLGRLRSGYREAYGPGRLVHTGRWGIGYRHTNGPVIVGI